MEVLDLIYHQFFFTSNSSGCQSTTSQYVQPLAPQTLALAAAATHCVLSEYASRNKATALFSRDEYWVTSCPSPVIELTLKATSLINHTFVGRLIPPSPAAPLRKHRRSSLPICTLQPGLLVYYFVPQSIPPLLVLLCWHRHTWIPSVWNGASLYRSTVYTPLSMPLSIGLELPNSHQRSSVWIVTHIFRSAFLTALRFWLSSPGKSLLTLSFLALLGWESTS